MVLPSLVRAKFRFKPH